ncbi:MAG: SDR family NAD(P)-dependent oxidoreductase [Planctomycetota bacterium]|nr:SDR family NAD(P)-dependent oxidoreductase [Planctomycetota bacterium]
MPRDLTGLPIAISGAGTGIGRATAIACARAGMPVALSGRREAPLREVEERITSEGGRALVMSVDVADAAACARFVDATIERFGTVYAVFANAGYGLRGPVHELTDQAIRDIFETNFWGTLNLFRPALAHMLEHREGGTARGHLLACSSCLSKLGTPFTSPYSASKAMQDHIGRGMRHELAPLGVRVSTVHPIGTRTEFFDAAASRDDSVGQSLAPPRMFTQPPDRVARAVVGCLRKPRGEVWTSHTVRLVFAAATAFPGITDRVLGRALRSKGAGAGS